jgi:hypothetical protein
MPIIGRDYSFRTLKQLKVLPFKLLAVSRERLRLLVSSIIGTRS